MSPTVPTNLETAAVKLRDSPARGALYFFGIAAVVASIAAALGIWAINGAASYGEIPVPGGTWIGLGLLFAGIAQCALFTTVVRIADVLVAAYAPPAAPGSEQRTPSIAERGIQE
jgi:hypothetical protein